MYPDSGPPQGGLAQAGGSGAAGGEMAGTGRGFLSATALKTIAIIAMLIDHAAVAFFPDYYGLPALPLHMIGRITGPVMFFFVAEGYRHTRNKNRYTLRLAVFAAVSYLPFVFFRTGGLPTAGTWLALNVIYTLLIGHLALRARHEIRQKGLAAFVVVLCFLFALPGDWGWQGVLFILLFDIFYGDFKKQALAYAVVPLAQMLPLVFSLFVGPGGGAPLAALRSGYMGALLLYAAYFIPLGLLAFYNGRLGRGGAVAKWGFYAFYPLHLLILGLIRY